MANFCTVGQGTKATTLNFELLNFIDSKLPVDIIKVCDRSKTRSGKTKDTFLKTSGARYFKHEIYDNTDFPTYLVSNGCWYEECKEKEHLQQQTLHVYFLHTSQRGG